MAGGHCLPHFQKGQTEGGEVAAGAEMRASAKHQGAYMRVRLSSPQSLGQRADERGIQGIASIRAIEGDDGHRPVPLK
jgi:hypothetical protein